MSVVLPGHVTELIVQTDVTSAAASLQVFTHHGDFIQCSVHCARMSEYKTEETVMAAHAVGHDRVCSRHRVLLSHHRR